MTVTSGGRAGNEASIRLLLLVGGLGTRLVYDCYFWWEGWERG